MEQKKSAVDLTELAIGIVVLGISVAIGATILLNTRDSQITNLPTYTVNNETLTISGGTGTLSNSWVKSVDAAINSTTNGLFTQGVNYSYTINSGNGLATITNLTLFKTANVTYTVYNVSDPRFTLPNTASIGLSEYGNWFKILSIVGISAVILAIIFMAFKDRNTSSSGVTY